MSERVQPVLFHHHGFKCAGTTFAALLDRNFPGAVLYAEGTHESRRLPWQAVVPAIEEARPRAVSSHLATVPPRGRALARLHVAFVREPRARLASAFLYEQQIGAPAQRAESFLEYQQRFRFREISNYQTRHLSVQDFGGWTRRQGWEARPELVSFSRPDLFIGVVERMAESLLVLERRLAAFGIAFDAAFATPANVTPANRRLQDVLRQQVFGDMVELDDVLYARAESALSTTCRRLGIGPDEIAAFEARCAALAADGAPAVAVAPDTWTYLPAVAPPPEP